MCKSTSDYITCIRKCKYEYDKHETSKLIIARLKNTKIYWEVGVCGGEKKLMYNIGVYEKYFINVNNQDDAFLYQIKMLYL